MFAPCEPISESSFANDPGLSLILIRTVKYLPAAASPVCIILSNNNGSIFPPDKTIATGPSKAFGFAQSINYYCKETIRYLLAKANSHGNALSKLEVQIKENSQGG